MSKGKADLLSYFLGKEYNVARERIRQIKSKTMSKLRQPSRSKALMDFLDN